MEDRYISGNKASVLGIIGNIFLCIIKTIFGFMSNSQAMISDALNSAGDIINSIFTYIGNKIASKPRDEDHVMGHGKAEYIYALLISLVILYLCARQMANSILSIINNSKVNFSIWLIVICFITIMVKSLLFVYVNNLAKKHNNILLKANAIDHINDVAITTLSLISIILGLFGITFIDGLVGIMISLWIFYVELKIFKESYDVLMDKGMDNKTKNKILTIIKNHPEIKRINHLNSTPVGYQYQVNFSIYVDGNLSTFESHKIADELEHEIGAMDEIYLVRIHVNPYGQEKKN